MTTLDALLSQWLGEADPSRAECAFHAYFAIAFPSLVRHVQMRTGWDIASAEDIAQEALLRFFERAGRGRREAAGRVGSAAMQLTAARVDPLPSPRVIGWAHEVCAFCGSAIGFRPPTDDAWRNAALALSERILALQRTGWELLDEMRRKLAVRNASEASIRALHPVCAVSDPPLEFDPGEAAGFARMLAREHSLNTSCAQAVEQLCPGAAAFTQTALTIIETLPRLRLPTNGYLFEIATSIFLDEVKRRNRRKRGGMPGPAAGDGAGSGVAADLIAHPIEIVPDERPAGSEGELWPDQLSVPEGQSPAAAGIPSPPADPVARYESEEFLCRFYEYLHLPVARAVSALEEARSRGKALAEQCRLESVSRKFSRMMCVLSMVGEGYTQEETARRAGLSRNQVKYILESVKEAYARFAAQQPRLPRPRADREGESHAS